jgi:23S rRNA (adenine2503-C2)-methyltransferase
LEFPALIANAGTNARKIVHAAFALMPEELRALPPEGAGTAAFAALQRPWLWSAQGPELSPRARGVIAPEAFALPTYEAVRSADGSTKLLFKFGEDSVEAVHMPRRDRVTLCLSSQVGCAIGCEFCATASMGFRRHLTAGEIVSQVLTTVHAFGPRHPSSLTLVFMGMGEPLHNLANVLKAIEVLCHPRGMGLSSRRITVSTSGLVPQMKALAQATVRPLLALSLNATVDSLRQKLMPIGQRYSLIELAATLKDFPLRPSERILLEYVLLDGVNDTEEDARRLAEFGDGFRHHINLIPFNAHELSSFRAPSKERVAAFAKAVMSHRPCLLTVRNSRARDVQGACGQLVVLRTQGARRRSLAALP